jgi:co-chaperonin GroES (HSP10)
VTYAKPKKPAGAPEDGDDRPGPVARHVQPLGPRVLVRVLKSPDRSESGLFLPQGVKDASSAALLGEVLEVARTLPTTEPGATVADEDDPEERIDLGQNVSGIPLGANVLFEKDKGVAVPWDDSLRILEVRHVLAIVDIIPEDEIQ